MFTILGFLLSMRLEVTSRIHHLQAAILSVRRFTRVIQRLRLFLLLLLILTILLFDGVFDGGSRLRAHIEREDNGLI